MASNQSAWGIDVGVSSLKAIKLRREGDRVAVEAFEVIEHDKFLTEPDVDRDMLIRQTLGKFMSKYAVRRETVYIGVPGSSTFARFVKLPPVETRKIPEIVRFEAIQQIPFPLDQVNWDYHTFQHPDSPDVEVGIFAMKKELVAQVMSNFQAVDLAVQGVQMSPLAVYNAAAYDGMTADKGTIVIDMGAEHTDLVIMDQGRLWLRTINIGGNHFTDALAKSFKQPFPRAEQLKKTAATSKYQKQIYQAMRPIFADLVAEIQRSIGFYNSSHRDSKLERIVCMGNPFKLPNLQKYLQQELKLDVFRLENFKEANVDKAAAFSENILSMTAAYGLAIQALGMAPIDTTLLPTEIARKMLWRKKQPWFIGAAAVVALGAVGVWAQYYLAKSAYASQEDDRTKTAGVLARANTDFHNWQNLADDYSNERKKVDSQMNLAINRAVWPWLRTDIYNSLPQSNNKPERIIVMNIESEYIPKLSDRQADFSASTALPGTPGTPAPVIDSAAANGGDTSTVPPAPTKPSGQIGDSDHGFIVTITGYYKTGSRMDELAPAKFFKETLLAKSPGPPPDKLTDPEPPNERPYYLTGTSGSIRGDELPTASVGMARGGMGTPQTTGDKGPWDTAHGPYWDQFITDLTGIQPPAAGGISGGGGLMGGNPGVGANGVTTIDLPPYTDLAGAHPPKTPVPSMIPPNRNAAPYYQFSLRFKVHVKN